MAGRTVGEKLRVTWSPLDCKRPAASGQRPFGSVGIDFLPSENPSFLFALVHLSFHQPKLHVPSQRSTSNQAITTIDTTSDLRDVTPVLM